MATKYPVNPMKPQSCTPADASALSQEQFANLAALVLPEVTRFVPTRSPPGKGFDISGIKKLAALAGELAFEIWESFPTIAARRELETENSRLLKRKPPFEPPAWPAQYDDLLKLIGEVTKTTDTAERTRQLRDFLEWLGMERSVPSAPHANLTERCLAANKNKISARDLFKIDYMLGPVDRDRLTGEVKSVQLDSKQWTKAHALILEWKKETSGQRLKKRAEIAGKASGKKRKETAEKMRVREIPPKSAIRKSAQKRLTHQK